jgi:hypothetical protein
MPMRDKVCFVQFIHPGGEHIPDNGLIREWNRNKHKRKFLRQAGKYIAGGKVEKGEMVFWGEWEPESKAERIENPIIHGPHYIHKPYYVGPKSYDGLQNTDPFVFGEQFHYTWCQQRTKKGAATQLRHLSKGSVILFGSCEDKNVFVLDTVFVVDRWIDHARQDYRKALAEKISQEYQEITILPGYQEPSDERKGCALEMKSCASADSQEAWRLYFGVTHDNPLHGMYSFFPCQQYQAKSKGFARPRISLPGRITDNLNQGKKYRNNLSLDEMKLLWDKVVKQVKKERLALGVYARMPATGIELDDSKKR